jgi:hypothetical protein
MHPPDTLLTSAQTAKLFHLTTEALRKWRRTGKGPKWIAINPRVIRYKFSDVTDFITSKLTANPFGIERKEIRNND